MFDPMFASFEDELKPLEVTMPSAFDMNMEIQGNPVDDGETLLFDPISVKSEILPLGDDTLESNWDVSDTITENNHMFSPLGNDVETPYSGDGGLGFQVNTPTGFSYGGMSSSYSYPILPYHLRAEFSDVGAWNRFQLSPNLIERRQKRMIKNRESAARSRARRVAYNAQQKLEIQRLKQENEFLKRVLQTLVGIVKMNIEKELKAKGIMRTFSAELPPSPKL
ncbi:hypothetical protein ACHQM5_025461 [Ranunculus cassubicifolius]